MNLANKFSKLNRHFTRQQASRPFEVQVRPVKQRLGAPVPSPISVGRLQTEQLLEQRRRDLASARNSLFERARAYIEGANG